MNVVKRLNLAKRLVDRLLGSFLVFLMGLSVINVLWQVFSRFVLGSPSSFTEELARFLLIWIGVLGAGYAAGQRDHLALELLPEKLEGASYEWVQILIQSCILLFAVPLLIVGGARLVFLQLTLGQTSASLNVPMGYVYLVLPLSGVAMVFYATVHIAQHLHALRSSTADTPPGAPEQESVNSPNQTGSGL